MTHQTIGVSTISTHLGALLTKSPLPLALLVRKILLFLRIVTMSPFVYSTD